MYFSYRVNKFCGEILSFFAIFDNGVTFILNKLFCNGDVDDKGRIVGRISKLRDNDMVVESNGIRVQKT